MFKISGIITTTITGLASAGTISAPGMKVGDRIIQATSPPAISTSVNIFEAIVTVDDQIQQVGGFGAATELPFEILALRL